jgi:glycosyltransferase involved in cell wall biosynthesis
VKKTLRLAVAAQPLHSGTANHVIGLVETLPADRFVVDLACPRESTMWSALAGRPGVELHAIKPHRHPTPLDVLSWLTLLRVIRRADVVHVHSSKAGFLGRLAAVARARQRACVFTPHGWSFWAAGGLERRLYLGLERLAARWCAAIVTLSAAERDAGLEAGVGRPEQYRIIPNGVDLERFSVARRPVRGRLLMVGRLEPPKRPDLAIRALAVLRESMPEAELQLAGDGSLRAGAEELARELGVAGAVTFLGNRSDIAGLLAEAECALLASDYEGCPLAVVEAMAAGVAVVGTAVGGVGELVEDGRTGFLAPADDAAALAARLEDALRTPERARELGQAGRLVAEERLSLEAMVEQLVQLYEEVSTA